MTDAASARDATASLDSSTLQVDASSYVDEALVLFAQSQCAFQQRCRSTPVDIDACQTHIVSSFNETYNLETFDVGVMNAVRDCWDANEDCAAGETEANSSCLFVDDRAQSLTNACYARASECEGIWILDSPDDCAIVSLLAEEYRVYVAVCLDSLGGTCEQAESCLREHVFAR